MVSTKRHKSNTSAVNHATHGTKAAPLLSLEDPGPGAGAGELRLYDQAESIGEPFGNGFDETFKQRIAEAEAFYRRLFPRV